MIGRLVSSGACSGQASNATTQAVHAANVNTTSLDHSPPPRQLVFNFFHSRKGKGEQINAMVPHIKDN
jgi:hypothetical protein